MSKEEAIMRLVKKLSESEQENLCGYIQSQYCVEDDSNEAI